MTIKTYQVQDPAGGPQSNFDPMVKCLLMAVYQKNGKTVLQPLTSGKDAATVAELFQTKTIEVWLSNGENDFAQFDIDILKYKQVSQPLTKCHKVKNQPCLKNHFENLVSCEQCPLSVKEGGI